MNSGVGYIYQYRNLSLDIKTCVQFDSGLGASELGLVVYAHTQIDRRRIECVEFAPIQNSRSILAF